MNKDTYKLAVQTAVAKLMEAKGAVEAIPNPYDLFDFDAVKTKTVQIDNTQRFVEVSTSQPDLDALNDYFHSTEGKSGRSLNHSLNKVNKDWTMKNLRTPRGWRAIKEVAVDCNIDPVELAQMIQYNPRFVNGPIGEAARELLEQSQ